MAARLKLGSYIIDSQPGANASTTQGVRLLFPNGPRASATETREGMAVQFVAQVTGADIDAIKTAIGELRDRVIGLAFEDVVLEAEPDVTLHAWRVSTNLFSRVRGELDHEIGIDPVDGSLWGLCILRLRIERIGVAAGQVGGALDSFEWSFGQDSNGNPSVSTEGTFATAQAARAWVASMRKGGSGRPGWLGDSFRGPFPLYRYEQQPVASGGSAGEQHNTPCVAQVVFRALPQAWATNSAFDDIQDAEVQWTKTARPPIDQDSGTTPGFDVLATGSLQFKLEDASGFDNGDTAGLSSSALRSKAEAAFEVLENQAKTFFGETWHQRRLELSPDFRRGVVFFRFTALTGEVGRIIAWDEELVITRTGRDGRVAGSDGDRVHPHRLGPQLVCNHRLMITALAPREYPVPSFILGNSRWAEDYLRGGKPHYLDSEPGMDSSIQAVQQKWEAQWTLLNDGNAQPREGTSFSSLSGSGS